MDTRGNDVNGCKENPMGSVDPKTEKLINGEREGGEEEEEDSDCNSLLSPRRGGMSRKSDKIRRKVQWNDKNGNKLVEILEFEPSDVSDSDDDEDSDSCICTIM
ncbi:hypothetical protein L484_003722 [Morus notabilis]|uniref:Uncharacterized protein n=1 Tax=Morus notabilis TaxID=981085 RepID=W9SDS4_9ROSA|nr:uncharacterized protein LOC21387246 [Morus notabilis]EXC24414.1 hypothetical protein L484_003722 [Morus notabilis]